MFTVYLLKFEGLKKQGYIGVTYKTLKQRKYQHEKEAQRKRENKKVRWLKAHINTKMLLIIPLEKGIGTDTLALEKEKYYIAMYQRKGYILHNSNTGGGGPILKAHVENLKKNHKGNTGKIFSLDHRQKISQSNMGKKMPKEFMEALHKHTAIILSKPVRGKLGDKVIVASNGKEAAAKLKEMNLPGTRSAISRACTGNRKTVGGYTWEYITKDSYNQLIREDY